MGYALHDWAICDNCKTQTKLEEPHVSIGWREIEYLSNATRGYDYTQPTVFCSWSCIVEFAAKHADMDRWMSGKVTKEIDKVAQRIVEDFQDNTDVVVTRTGATITFTKKGEVDEQGLHRASN